LGGMQKKGEENNNLWDPLLGRGKGSFLKNALGVRPSKGGGGPEGRGGENFWRGFNVNVGRKGVEGDEVSYREIGEGDRGDRPQRSRVEKGGKIGSQLRFGSSIGNSS